MMGARKELNGVGVNREREGEILLNCVGKTRSRALSKQAVLD